MGLTASTGFFGTVRPDLAGRIFFGSGDGFGTVFQLWFSDHEIHNWRDAEAHADEARFTRWYQEMLVRGVLFHPLQFENLFVSLVHTDEDVDQTLSAAAEAFEVLAEESVSQ